MHIVRNYPNVNWKCLWTNLYTAWISDTQRSKWYMMIHDLTPTNDRLAAIKLTETNRCSTCEAIDTTHRLTLCGESKLIWNWTRARIAAITRTKLLYVPETWTLRPVFLICPSPQRHKDIVWMLAHLVNYHMQGKRRISLLDYIEFMRRARWKADSPPTRRTAVGNYLSILDPPSSRTTHTPQARHTLGRLPLAVIYTLSAA